MVIRTTKQETPGEVIDSNIKILDKQILKLAATLGSVKFSLNRMRRERRIWWGKKKRLQLTEGE